MNVSIEEDKNNPPVDYENEVDDHPSIHNECEVDNSHERKVTCIFNILINLKTIVHDLISYT